MADWLRGARRWHWFAGAFGVILVAVVVSGLVASRGGGTSAATTADTPTASSTPTRVPTETPTPGPTPIRHSGLLDGVPMTDEEWEARKDLLPVAVMVDNSPSAYPQSGLDRADLVYEAFVEGGITRFMAVFWRQEADRVEPVRSARSPFVIWADELGALYGHAGGAITDNDANAIGQIVEWHIRDLNAFGSGADSKYYRDSERYAPYNLVTNTAWLREAADALGYKGPPTVAPWLFKADGTDTPGAPMVGAFEVDFEERRIPSQVIQWRWDAATKSYLRFQSGGPHVDAVTGEQLRFTNVVVMRVPWSVVDESGHVLLDQFGQGPATIFMDGRKIEGTWKKADRAGRTRFYDAGGSEVAFNRGPIFIEVLGPQSLLMTAETPDGLPPLPEYTPPPPTAPEPGPSEDESTPVTTPTAGPAPSASPSVPPPTASTTPPSATPPRPSPSVPPSTTPTTSQAGGTASPSPTAVATATGSPPPGPTSQ
jgi:hypothetical protein